MKLLAGNCELDNQDEYGSFTTLAPTDVPDSNAQESVNFAAAAAELADGIESAKQTKDIFNLGASFKLSANTTYPLVPTDDLPWQPILEGNSLDKELGESSRSLSSNEPVEIFEPVLTDRRLAVNRGRNLHDFGLVSEIVEPVLKATTPRHKKAKEMVLTEAPPPAAPKQPDLLRISPVTARPKSLSSNQEEAITVQLFPFRLGDLLQRAERYARETLLPLISVQAPRFFGFHTQPQPPTTIIAEEPKTTELRKPRYIPRFEEADFLKATPQLMRQNKTTNRTMRVKTAQEMSVAVADESQEQRNIFQLLRGEETKSRPQERKLHSSFNDVNYYTNVLTGESRAMMPEDPSYEPVFIDLPTYRPPKAKALRSATSGIVTTKTTTRLKRRTDLVRKLP